MPTVLIAGGTGLIGMRLSELLRENGYEVLHLSRKEDKNAAFPAYRWDVEKGEIDESAVAKSDYVINLAGAGIADKPWTEARKRLIIESRTQSARLLLATFQKLNKKPAAYLSGAAIGYYGNRGDEWMEETEKPGTGFLSESCILWEKAIQEVMNSGIRTVALRIGIVLSTRGGALEKMMLPLQLLTATYFGDGKQWYSWIHIDDVCRMFLFAIQKESMQGFYNAVAPTPLRNKAFTQALVIASGKPALLLPAPAFALRLALGEMADTILGSTKVSAKKIQDAGFAFNFPTIEVALKDLFKKKI